MPCRHVWDRYSGSNPQVKLNSVKRDQMTFPFSPGSLLQNNWRSVLSLTVMAVLFCASTLKAQEPDSKKADDKKEKSRQAVESLLPKPVVVVNVASVERVLQDIDFIFELGERPEIAEIASASLANVNDLEGLDKNRNLGMELYLKTGLLPQPVFIPYFPVAKISDFLETFQALLPGMMNAEERLPREKDLYVIDAGNSAFYFRVEEKYAHQLHLRGGAETDLELFETHRFKDPAQQYQSLTAQYEVAVHLDLSSIPELMRTTFLGFFRTAIETQLQQRDGESQAAYELRKMSGKQNLENIEYFLNEGQQLTVGAHLDQEQKLGIVDMLIKARPNSDLARSMKNMPGQASYFSVVTARETLPLAASISTIMARRDRKTYLKYLTFFEKQLGEKLLSEEERLQQTNSVQQFFAPVKSQVDKGHLDAFVQLVSTPSKKFALIGGIKVAPSSNLPAALLDLINRIEKQSDNKARIFTNAETVQGIALHQLQPDTKSADDRQRRFLGGVPSLYVGADSEVIWFAMGTEIAVAALNEAIEQIHTATPEERKIQRTAPFQFEFHLKPWLQLFSEEEINASDNMRVLDGVFDSKNDLVLITTQPTETGIRSRFLFEEGYLKLLGVSIAKRFDQNQERRSRRNRDRERKRDDRPQPKP
ncbi:hypothetical protein Pan153_54210 [Gimesia panareensis]|uniref:Uncharacterized protein n=2 Tax=Gimesia panareensis TaxID=2527978 RepID=A0A518FWI3_9PLAN|nr:hypothetical protein Pan153_54210 [Gimesia panareensis]